MIKEHNCSSFKYSRYPVEFNDSKLAVCDNVNELNWKQKLINDLFRFTAESLILTVTNYRWHYSVMSALIGAAFNGIIYERAISYELTSPLKSFSNQLCHELIWLNECNYHYNYKSFELYSFSDFLRRDINLFHF